ncbi:tetratricopeptide repeat protein, partial [Micromonospora sp. C97]|uniref:tetratricopeptide repeat protein n=1 Tax=Micromonospora sp. C97 TaxID=2824883 RepID=UPI001B38857C
MSQDEAPIRVVGWGFLRLPGERSRWRRAEEAARRLIELAEEARARTIAAPSPEATRATDAATPKGSNALASESGATASSIEDIPGGTKMTTSLVPSLVRADAPAATVDDEQLEQLEQIFSLPAAEKQRRHSGHGDWLLKAAGSATLSTEELPSPLGGEGPGEPIRSIDASESQGNQVAAKRLIESALMSVKRADPERAREYFARAIAADPHSALALRSYAKFLMESLGDFQAALELYEKAVSIDPSDIQLQRNLSIAHGRLGDMAQDRGRLDEAHTAHRAALAIDMRLAEADPDNAEAQRDLSITHSRLGDIAHARGNLDDAETAYRAALTIHAHLAEADPDNAEAQRDLSITHSRLGDIAHARGNLDDAETAYRAALAIDVRLAEADPDNAEAQRDLSITHSRLGDIAHARGNL